MPSGLADLLVTGRPSQRPFGLSVSVTARSGGQAQASSQKGRLVRSRGLLGGEAAAITLAIV